MMVNLPAFSAQVLIFIFIADVAMLAMLYVAMGGLFTFSMDLTGRPIHVSLRRKVIAALILVILLAYFALQIVLVAKFLPYWTEPGQTGTEPVTAMSISCDQNRQPISYWITTTHHRFGVQESIYQNLWIGEVVDFRYRLSDDTLFTIQPATDPSGRPLLPANTTPPTSPSMACTVVVPVSTPSTKP
jgi:hypothetical protein